MIKVSICPYIEYFHWTCPSCYCVHHIGDDQDECVTCDRCGSSFEAVREIHGRSECFDKFEFKGYKPEELIRIIDFAKMKGYKDGETKAM